MGSCCFLKVGQTSQEEQSSKEYQKSLITQSDRTAIITYDSQMRPELYQAQLISLHQDNNQAQMLKQSFTEKRQLYKKMSQDERSNFNDQEEGDKINQCRAGWEKGDFINQTHFIDIGYYFKGSDSVSINQDASKYPYDCIGLIRFKKIVDAAENRLLQFMGTAFLIAPNLVLTAAHNLVDSRRRPLLEIEFYPMLHGKITSLTERYEITKICVLENYRENNDASIDFAIAKLSSHVKRKKYIMIGQDYPKQNKKAMIVGYPAVQDVANDIFRQFGASGQIAKISQQNIYYNINTMNGQSGSPVIVQFVQGLFFVVGIHNKSNLKEEFNYGCHLSNAKVKQIKNWVQEIAQQSKFIIVDFAKIRSLSNVTFSGIIRKNKLTPEIQLYLKMIKAEEQNIYSSHLGQLLFETGKKFRLRADYDDSIAYLEKALLFYETSNQRYEIQIANINFEIGVTLKEMKRYKQALKKFKEAISTFNKHLIQVSIIASLKNIGSCYIKLEKFLKAETIYMQAFQLDKKYLDKNPQKIAFYQNNLALAYTKNRKYAKAQQLYEKALNCRKRIMKGDLQLCKCYFNLAHCQSQLGPEKIQSSINGYYQAISIMIGLNMTSHHKFFKYINGFKYTLSRHIEQYNREILISLLKIITELEKHTTQFQTLKQIIINKIQSIV